ncbi:hypothetical protein B4U80_14518 [Leptotrombidium deliense]|uniref:Caspase family p20 domain-containing protein n=1 Tax=Leptotrombidium deliense TaxID=299467 RepID=A0A443RUU5_9ACAR|nr:hypothetical protein B4U80_14518 [Leptotrombidium deliense]
MNLNAGITKQKRDVVFGSDGVAIHLDTLINLFNGERCKYLSKKPKLIIINGPRGESLSEYEDYFTL